MSRVTEIEVHDITLEYCDWTAYQLEHYYGQIYRTIYVAHTDDGLIGLGEGRLREPEEIIDRYVGSNPFDWMGDETSIGLGTAMYDLMGKAAGVPVGSWTVSTHPSRMAEAVTTYASQGYTWMKFHLSPFENVLDQTEAMQEVAPEGFRIHYDFTNHGTQDHMPELLDQLSNYRIAGCFEDPLPGADLDGYIELRQRSRLPIILHHYQTQATYEIYRRPADAYMLGYMKIGEAVRRAGLFAAADAPFMMQNVGGHITRAMTLHMMAAFPSATFHHLCDAETWKSDVVVERLEPVNGFVRIPEAPGLGLSLDRKELQRLESLDLPRPGKWIVKSRFANGSRMYNIADPDHSMFMVRPDSRPLIPMSYVSPIETEYWDDDGSAEYRVMFERIERDGMVLERG
jgi:L-alanine-DL-glutamate epimerase-like enolase superfamily enzyme